MTDNDEQMLVDGMGNDVMPSGTRITPQPGPTSSRIKALLSRALMAPDTLKPAEVREMAASVVYYLISEKKA